jgi:general secretion pathway protein M
MLQRGSLLSRVLALILLGALLTGAYGLLIAPVVELYRATDEAIESSETLLQRHQTLAAQRSDLAARLNEEKAQAAAIAGYLDGPSDPLALAQLQDLVKGVIEAAGGELRSTQTLPAQTVDISPGTRRATLRVQMVVAIDGLAAILYKLESGQPCILIDDLAVRSQRTRRRLGGSPEAAPLLDITLELSGFVRAASA